MIIEARLHNCYAYSGTYQNCEAKLDLITREIIFNPQSEYPFDLSKEDLGKQRFELHFDLSKEDLGKQRFEIHFEIQDEYYNFNVIQTDLEDVFEVEEKEIPEFDLAVAPLLAPYLLHQKMDTQLSQKTNIKKKKL